MNVVSLQINVTTAAHLRVLVLCESPNIDQYNYRPSKLLLRPQLLGRASKRLRTDVDVLWPLTGLRTEQSFFYLVMLCYISCYILSMQLLLFVNYNFLSFLVHTCRSESLNEENPPPPQITLETERLIFDFRDFKFLNTVKPFLNGTWA